MVGVLIRRSFLKYGGKNASFFCCESVAECEANKLDTVLAVSYCVRHTNQYNKYCAVLWQVLAVEVQWYLPDVINWPNEFHVERTAVKWIG